MHAYPSTYHISTLMSMLFLLIQKHAMQHTILAKKQHQFCTRNQTFRPNVKTHSVDQDVFRQALLLVLLTPNPVYTSYRMIVDYHQQPAIVIAVLLILSLHQDTRLKRSVMTGYYISM